MKSLSKFNVLGVLKEHHKTFYDANIGTSDGRFIARSMVFVYYLIPFILSAVALSLVFLCIIKLESIEKFTEVSLTFVSIFAPLLLSTLVLVFDIQCKLKDTFNTIEQHCQGKQPTNEIEQESIHRKSTGSIIIAKEMFANICFTEILCVFIILASFISILIAQPIVKYTLFIVITFALTLFILTLLMIIKRLFSLLY